MANTGTLQEILPDDLSVFNALSEDEKYKLEVAVPQDGWETYCVSRRYAEKQRNGWAPEEKEAVIRGDAVCPVCKDSGLHPEIQLGYANVFVEGEIKTCKAYRNNPIDCDCQIWKHVWRLVRNDLGIYSLSLQTLKPDLLNRLPLDVQQAEIDYTRKHESESFLLLGPSGTGKTTLAYALYRAAYEREAHRFWSPDLKGINFKTRWIWRGNFNDLLNQFNAKQKDQDGTVPDPDVTQQKIKTVAHNGFRPVLIIEEVDKIELNTHRINFLFHLIDEVINAKGQLILTTNLTMVDFEANLTANDEIRTTGETIIRRLTDRVNIRNYFKFYSGE